MNNDCTPAAMTARITFSKTGFARYISHLDLQRAMMRVLRRAEVPLWMTKGFNPHPYLNFCSPLSVGVEGENELLDVKLSEERDTDWLKAALAAALPTGFAVKQVEKAGADFAGVEYALYRLELALPEEKVREFLEQEAIPVLKKTKSSELTVDLKQHFEVREILPDGEKTILTGVLPCGKSLNINPLLLCAALSRYAGNEDISCRICRVGFLDGEKKAFGNNKL